MCAVVCFFFFLCERGSELLFVFFCFHLARGYREAGRKRSGAGGCVDAVEAGGR